MIDPNSLNNQYHVCTKQDDLEDGREPDNKPTQFRASRSEENGGIDRSQHAHNDWKISIPEKDIFQ